MNILEKFDQVKIKPDERISDDDRAFCASQQEAYEKAHEIFKQLAKIVGDGQAEQVEIFSHCKREIYTTYLGSTCEFSEDSAVFSYCTMMQLPETFVLL